MSIGIDKAIARALVYAQIASDGGKGKYRLKTSEPLIKGEVKSYYENNLSTKIACKGYQTKDGWILTAINLANRTPKFNYYVSPAEDHNSNKCCIVYFSTKINGERYQISFHSFGKEVRLLAGSGTPQKWRRRQPAIFTAQKLIDFYGL